VPNNKFVYQSFVNDIRKEVKANARESLMPACKLAQKEIKAVLNTRVKSNPGSPPGKLSGQLQKNIKYQIDTESAEPEGLIGSTDFRANILEFGSEKMEARPFEGPTLEKISPQIKEIMSGKLVDD
jgi:HK97 gp10 family phage protein